MHKRIIFTGDFLYNSQRHNEKYFNWLFKIFYPIIKDALNDNVELMFQIKNNQNEVFSREHFYKLAGISNIKECYNQYDINNFNDKQLSYLKSFFTSDDIIIGFELYPTFTKFLNNTLQCTIIDFAFHSYKLFDDLAFAIYTNDKSIYNKLLQYKVPKNKFLYYANYWKIFMEQNNLVKDQKLKNNCAIFVGQTLTDKSVEKDGIFLNISHFENYIKTLSQEFTKIYYLPHPALWKGCKNFFKYLNNCPYIEVLKNNTTYGLLASNKVQKVIGISTSVLYEAQYFNKEIEYLYKPLFNIDAPFEDHSYISIFEDYWSPKFWADILSPVCEVNETNLYINYFKGSSNKLRNIRDLYWGYKDLDPIKRIPSFEESVKRLYVKYLSPLL